MLSNYEENLQVVCVKSKQVFREITHEFRHLRNIAIKI